VKKAAVLMLALWLLCGAAQADVNAAALRIAQQMMAGEYAEICAQFDESMRAGVDEAALEAGFAAVSAQLGDCFEAEILQADDASAVVQLAHEKGASMLSLAFDAEGRISAMYIAPQLLQIQPLARSLPEGAQAVPVILFEGSDHPLSGELIMPADADVDTPYVIFTQGSGPSDMDETIGANKPFRDLAYDLAALGVGSLRYDKITFVHPHLSYETIDAEYLIPTQEALRVLGERTGAVRIYLIGHSQGGMLTPYLVDHCGLDGGIALAGTPLQLWEISMAQNLAMLEAVPEAQRQIAMTQIETEREKGFRLAQMSDEEAAQTTVFGMPGVYLWHMARLDQAQIAMDSGKPYLFLWGEADFQVDRAAFEAWHECLGDDAKFSYITYPGLNHLFMPAAETDSILNAQAAYASPKSVEGQVARDIAGWIFANK